MRRSTARLCVELFPEGSDHWYKIFNDPDLKSIPEDIIALNDVNTEARVIASLQLSEYHTLCYWNPSQLHAQKTLAGRIQFNLGGVICCHDRFDVDSESVDIASLTDPDFDSHGWDSVVVDFEGFRTAITVGQAMMDGWTR